VFAISLATSGPPGCLNPTVVDGYIFHANGTPAGGVNVTVTTSASSCNKWSTISEPTGYYAIPGLDIVGKTVTVSATYGPESGQASKYSSSSTIRINVTICAPPPQPTLVDQSDTHQTTVTLSWTCPASGYYGEAVTCYYSFNGGPWQAISPPKTESGLAYQTTYSWSVKASGYCDSAPATDTFTVYNNPPSAPTLVDQPNTHNTSVVLNWTSGSDPDGDSVKDIFYFDDDANPKDDPLYTNEFAVPPTKHSIPISGLSYGVTYYWEVCTCDDTGAPNNCTCAQDSFTVGNQPPTKPTLVDVDNISSTSVELSWTSGVDPEGDPTYDVYEFGPNGNYVTHISPASSPITQSGLKSFTLYTWRVKTCDQHGACSGWASDDFIVCLGEGVCPPCPPCRGGGGGGVISKYLFAALSAPASLNPNSSISLFLSLNSTSYFRNLTIDIIAPRGFYFKSRTFSLESGNAKGIIISGRAGSVKPGRYHFLAVIKRDNSTLISVPFVINVVSVVPKAICGNGICEVGENWANCIQDCHCGDRICQPEFGEDVLTCPYDCAVAKYAPPVLPILLIALLAIIVILLIWYYYEKRKGANIKYSH